MSLPSVPESVRKGRSAMPEDQTNEFTPVATIETPSGLRADISAREHNDRLWFSFTVSKTYMKNGQARASKWLQTQHIPELRKLLNDVEAKIDLEEDKDLKARSSAHPRRHG